MSLSDELESIGRDTRAIVDRVLSVLPDDEAEKLLAVLRNPERYPSGSIAEVLTKNGHKIGRASIQTWRDKDKIRNPEIYEGQNITGSAGGTTAAQNAKQRL